MPNAKLTEVQVQNETEALFPVNEFWKGNGRPRVWVEAFRFPFLNERTPACFDVTDQHGNDVPIRI